MLSSLEDLTTCVECLQIHTYSIDVLHSIELSGGDYGRNMSLSQRHNRREFQVFVSRWLTGSLMFIFRVLTEYLIYWPKIHTVIKQDIYSYDNFINRDAFDLDKIKVIISLYQASTFWCRSTLYKASKQNARGKCGDSNEVLFQFKTTLPSCLRA
jgi:hypothetical protein